MDVRNGLPLTYTADVEQKLGGRGQRQERDRELTMKMIMLPN